MTKKLFVIAIIMFSFGVLSGCSTKEHDCIVIHNKGISIFDDITVSVKDGYFYDRHDKFVVDENTVAVTVFFVNENGDEWMAK